MSKHTIVIDFTGAQEPAYSAGMEVLGGKVVAVAFADELERAEQLETQRDELLEALDAANLLLRTKRHACESTEVCRVLDTHIARNNAAIAKARGEA